MAYFNFFDTVSNIYSYAGDSEAEFQANCEGVAAILSEYHCLFDIYNEQFDKNNQKIVNLYDVNLNAGKEPVKVDQKLIDFLLYAKEIYQLTNGETNVMMGSVLKLWHDCRERASLSAKPVTLPTKEELDEAALHTDISLLEIDKENSTVRIADPDARIDVGALGKGYATEMAARHLQSKGASAYVLNIGGNIRIIGHKKDGSGWATGIKDPQNPSQFALKLTIADTSCVTSGDYERYFVVDGVRYHHVIDKDTRMPSTHFSSVTVFTPDSGLADALSTALFTMSYEDGLALLNKIGGVEAIWIAPDGEIRMSDGIKGLLIED